MGDSYQAVFDATRSRISNGDIGSAVERAVGQAGISYAVETILNVYTGEIYSVADQLKRPSVIFKPVITRDGNSWCCLLGDLPTGVVGFGKSPEDACLDFDKAWTSKLQEPQ